MSLANPTAFIQLVPVVTGMTRGDSTTGSTSRSHASGSGRSTSQSSVDADGQSIVPWYEYLEYSELSSRTYYQIQEVLERLKLWLMNQHPRRAQLKVGDRKTIPIVTRYVEEVPILPEEVAEFTLKVMPRCARPLAEVRAEISRRIADFLANYEERKRQEEAEQHEQALPAPEDRREAIKPFQRKEPIPRKRRKATSKL